MDKDTKIDGKSGKGETYETDSMADYEKYLEQKTAQTLGEMCIRDRYQKTTVRKMIDKAYGGDIIGVFDPGIFSIGDTLTTCLLYTSRCV